MSNNTEQSEIRSSFQTAKNILAAGGVFVAFYVAPAAGTYCATGSVLKSAFAWVAGNIALGITRDLSPRFSNWLIRKLDSIPLPEPK